MKLSKFILKILILIPTTSSAAVNLQSGSWNWDENFLNVHAHYNSRSLFKGVFGAGWCSDLDVELRLESGTWKKIKCGKAITEEAHKSSSEHLQVSYYSNGLVKEISDKGYRLRFYYESGLLTRVENSSGLIRSFSYDEMDNLTRISDREKHRLIDIAYGENDRVSRVSIPGLCQTTYQFQESVGVRSAELRALVRRDCPTLNAPTQTRTIVSHFTRQNREVSLIRVKEER